MAVYDPSGSPQTICLLIEFDGNNNATGNGDVAVMRMTGDCSTAMPEVLGNMRGAYLLTSDPNIM